jgi:hypothetical protein
MMLATLRATLLFFLYSIFIGALAKSEGSPNFVVMVMDDVSNLCLRFVWVCARAAIDSWCVYGVANHHSICNFYL